MTSTRRSISGGGDADPTVDDPDGTPVWLNDFPHTVAGEEAVTRRAFTRYLIAGSGVFAATTLGAAAWTSLRDLELGEPKEIIDLDDLPVGSAHLFEYPTPRDPAILLHLASGVLAAYSQKCTHLGCVVFYEEEDKELVCPCHEGIFDPTTGDPTAGPPERPLPAIALEMRGNTVWAMGVEHD